MLNKKYYQIQIVNNQTGEIIQDKNINNSNMTDYTKQVLRQYGEAKFKYKNTDTTISVLRFEDGNVKTMYQKVYHSEQNDESIEDVFNTENIYEICNDLCLAIKKFTNQAKNLSKVNDKLINAYNKKQDVILHKFDNLPQKNKYELTNEDTNKYLDIAIDIQAIRSNRRDIKNQKKLTDFLRSKNILTRLNNINNTILLKKDSIEQFNKNAIKQWNTGQIDLTKKYVEIPYKNFKDRVKIIANLQSKYGKITYDSSKKIIIAYNKCAKQY